MRAALHTALSALLLTLTAPAQCPPTSTRLLKNDNLPAVPPATPTGIAAIRGLCEGETAFTVFDNVQGSVTVDSMAVGVAAAGGVVGQTVVADLELYDGVTANAGGLGVYSLGPRLWSMSQNASANAQLQSHGLSAIDLSSFAVQVHVTSGKLVVAARVVLNPSGACATGYPVNLATDYDGFTAPCPSPGVNGIVDLSGLAFDPATYPDPRLLGLTLCQLNFYGGNWLIRACITEATPAATTDWSGFATPGQTVTLRFSAPGSPGDGYIALVGGSATTGTPTPWGTWTLDYDPWFDCFLGPCRGIMRNDIGILGTNGVGFAHIDIPNLPSAIGITWYASFFAHDPNDVFAWSAVGAPSAPIVIQ